MFGNDLSKISEMFKCLVKMVFDVIYFFNVYDRYFN